MEELKKKTYKNCIVPLCRSTTFKTPEKIFFNVPRSPDVRSKWCEAMRRDNKFNKPIEWNTRLNCCEDHFDLKEDMVNYWQYILQRHNVSRCYLKKGVLPHKFDCQRTYLEPIFQDQQSHTQNNTYEKFIQEVERKRNETNQRISFEHSEHNYAAPHKFKNFPIKVEEIKVEPELHTEVMIKEELDIKKEIDEESDPNQYQEYVVKIEPMDDEDIKVEPPELHSELIIKDESDDYDEDDGDDTTEDASNSNDNQLDNNSSSDEDSVLTPRSSLIFKIKLQDLKRISREKSEKILLLQDKTKRQQKEIDDLQLIVRELKRNRKKRADKEILRSCGME